MNYEKTQRQFNKIRKIIYEQNEKFNWVKNYKIETNRNSIAWRILKNTMNKNEKFNNEH